MLSIQGSGSDKMDKVELTIYALLFQTGYLTIKSTWLGSTGQTYDLGYPNYEVEQAFEQHWLANYLETSAGQMSARSREDEEMTG